MKKLVVLGALALLAVTTSQFVPRGGAAQESSINKRVAALEVKVKRLESKTKSLTTKTNALLGFAGCLANSAPIPSGRFTGYLYTPDHGTTVQEATALDATDTGETPQSYIVTIQSACLGSISRAKSGMQWHSARIMTARHHH